MTDVSKTSAKTLSESSRGTPEALGDSPSQDYSHRDDQTTWSNTTPGLKPL